MSTKILNQLATLRENSNKHLATNIIRGFYATLSSKGLNPIQLIVQEQIANANWIYKPRYNSDSLLQFENRHFVRRIRTLTAGQENNFTFNLNTTLLGGSSYPVLTAILGTAAGIASFGGGLLFAAATTALNSSQLSRRVLARAGDEIWQVEEIGKVPNSGILSSSDAPYKAIHINSYFLFDPFRERQYMVGKGWLIHEERNTLILD